MIGNRVSLRLRGADEKDRELVVDHVIAGTGYDVNVDRIPFLAPELRSVIARRGSGPKLDASFQSSVPASASSARHRRRASARCSALSPGPSTPPAPSRRPCPEPPWPAHERRAPADRCPAGRSGHPPDFAPFCADPSDRDRIVALRYPTWRTYVEADLTAEALVEGLAAEIMHRFPQRQSCCSAFRSAPFRRRDRAPSREPWPPRCRRVRHRLRDHHGRTIGELEGAPRRQCGRSCSARTSRRGCGPRSAARLAWPVSSRRRQIARARARLRRAASSNRQDRSGVRGRVEHAAPDPHHGHVGAKPRRSRRSSARADRSAAHAREHVNRQSLAQTLSRRSDHRYSQQPRYDVRGRERPRVARRLSRSDRGVERHSPRSSLIFQNYRHRLFRLIERQGAGQVWSGYRPST